MSDLALIALQAALAAISIRVLGGNVFRNLDRVAHPEMLLEIWGPIIIALPMVAIAGRMEPDVAGIGWIALGGPMSCSLLALGLRLLLPRGGLESGTTPSAKSMAVWVGCGLVYFLLSVAHDMTVWTGQTLFAIAAVLMWVNTPLGGGKHADSPADQAAGAGTLLALLCALGQGGVMLLIAPEYLPVCGALLMAHAAANLAAVTRSAGAGAAIRLGGWTATMGVLFSLGVLSIMFMVPAIFGALGQMEPAVTVKVARGFGRYAPEAMGLLLLGPMAWLGVRMSPGPRRALGGAILLGAAGLAAFRLASM